MTTHLDEMRKVYQECLCMLENTLADERATINLTTNRKWHDLSTQIDENLTMKNKTEKEQIQFYNDQLARIKLEHEENTRAARMRMELDQQQLQIELEQLKAMGLMNSEKFDYNYEILQKKVDDNARCRNLEKRHLVKLKETLSFLKKQQIERKQTFAQESKKINIEIVRFHDSFVELENRADHDAMINNKKVIDLFFYKRKKM